MFSRCQANCATWNSRLSGTTFRPANFDQSKRRTPAFRLGVQTRAGLPEAASF
jgi:hypothetical protein